MACPPALPVAGGMVRDAQAGGMIRSEEGHDLFLCALTIVDTHAHLPHALLQGTITTEEASNIPLQS